MEEGEKTHTLSEGLEIVSKALSVWCLGIFFQGVSPKERGASYRQNLSLANS